jgi:hypothetical protein
MSSGCEESYFEVMDVYLGVGSIQMCIYARFSLPRLGV